MTEDNLKSFITELANLCERYDTQLLGDDDGFIMAKCKGQYREIGNTPNEMRSKVQSLE